MKYAFIFMAALWLLAAAPKSCIQPKNDGGEDVEAVDPDAPTPAATDLIVMVYSNAYDGFLNVREQPDTKSPIIGKILNGPLGAVKMGEVGGWTIVKVGDTIGYASSRYLQTEPTAEFTDKDMEKCIQGIWATKQDGAQQAIVLMKGGVFVKGDFSQGWTSCGNWSVKGNVLNLANKAETSDSGAHWEIIESSEIWTVVNGDSIKNADASFTKKSVLSKKAYEALTMPRFFEMTQEEYNDLCEGIKNIVAGNFS
jgi:hypothetical protein